MTGAALVVLPLMLASSPAGATAPAQVLSLSRGRMFAVGGRLGAGGGLLLGVEGSLSAGPFELSLFADGAGPFGEPAPPTLDDPNEFSNRAWLGTSVGASARVLRVLHVGVAAEGGLGWARRQVDFATGPDVSDSEWFPFVGGRATLGLVGLRDRLLLGLMVAVRRPLGEVSLSVPTRVERLDPQLVVALVCRFQFWRGSAEAH